jgi:hypothetical protein
MACGLKEGPQVSAADAGLIGKNHKKGNAWGSLHKSNAQRLRKAKFPGCVHHRREGTRREAMRMAPVEGTPLHILRFRTQHQNALSNLDSAYSIERVPKHRHTLKLGEELRRPETPRASRRQDNNIGQRGVVFMNTIFRGAEPLGKGPRMRALKQHGMHFRRNSQSNGLR